MVKVSVIVPVYNVEKYLCRCLDSLLKQTLKDIEIICVNDASTDNSLSILYDYHLHYNNVIVVDLKENLHQGGARNKGLDIACGEYIIFVDSDDWIEREMLETLYKHAISKQADVITCDYDVINQNNIVLDKVITDQRKFCGKVDEKIRNELMNSSGSVCCHLYKRDLLISNEIRFPEKLFYEDNYFVPITCMYVKNYEHIPACLYHYYKNTESTTRKKNSSAIFDRLVTLELLIEYFSKKDWLIPYKEGINFYEYKIVFNTILLYLKTFDNPQKEVLLSLRKRLKVVLEKLKEGNIFYLRTTLKERLFQNLFLNFPYFILFYVKIIRK